jgi:dethiobiotin synthetase
VKSQPQSGRGLFITGTDTGVGKTTFGAGLVRYWRGQRNRVGAYKPVASGSVLNELGEPVWQDLEAYFSALDGEFPRDRICPQRFPAPLAPPVAARQMGATVDEALMQAGYEWWQPRADWMVVEGAGGLLSPLSHSQSNADLASALGLPLLIIGRLGLGTINHTLLTVEVAQQRQLPIRGVILNASQPSTDDESIASNPVELARRCTVPILGVLPYSADGDLLSNPDFLKIMEALGQS